MGRPGQDDLHPSLPWRASSSGGGFTPSSTRARPCTACGSFLLFFEQVHAAEETGGGADEPRAGCLNLVTNAVVTWNTVYMAAVIKQLRAEGKTVNEEDVARLSPAR